MPEINMARFVQLLEMATHEGTPPMEAHGAAKQIRKMVNDAGLEFSQIRFRRSLSELLAPPDQRSSGDLLAQIASLEKRHQQDQNEIKKLKQEVARLQEENVKHTAKRYRPREDGTYSWQAFSDFVTGRLRQLHGWRRVFAEQRNIPEMTLANWQNTDSVPAEDFEFAKAKLLPRSEFEARRQTFTFGEDDMVEALAQEGKTSEQISKILTKRLRRKKFSLGSIKKARQRVAGRNFVLARWDAGERDLETILADLRAEVATAKGHAASTRLFIERVLLELRDLPPELLSEEGKKRYLRRAVFDPSARSPTVQAEHSQQGEASLVDA